MRSVLILLCLVLLSGCASIVSGGPQVITINSNPPDAKMTLCNERTGQCMAVGHTPYSATLERSQGFFKPAHYKITCEKEGYNPAQQSLDAGMNGWYLGNILFGGLIGMLIVDPATGAMWDIKQQNVVVNLSPVALNQEPTPVVPYKGVLKKGKIKPVQNL
ncbi:MAG: hypothetical protein P8Z70_00225 [Desulfuromonadales bacterium]|jgi:uncharacterized protein YceK